jgi:cytoskeletal protein RodZ
MKKDEKKMKKILQRINRLPLSLHRQRETNKPINKMKSLVQNFKTSNRGDKEMLVFALLILAAFVGFVGYGLTLSIIRFLTTPIL